MSIRTRLHHWPLLAPSFWQGAPQIVPLAIQIPLQSLHPTPTRKRTPLSTFLPEFLLALCRTIPLQGIADAALLWDLQATLK